MIDVDIHSVINLSTGTCTLTCQIDSLIYQHIVLMNGQTITFVGRRWANTKRTIPCTAKRLKNILQSEPWENAQAKRKKNHAPENYPNLSAS